MVFSDDEEPQKQQRFTKLPLDRLGVVELETYIAELRAEIKQAEIEIARKQDVRNAADRFFKT